MSVTAWLKHISAKGLQRTKEDPEVFERVIFDLEPANSAAPLISDISELTLYQISILEEIVPDLNLVCNQWTEHDVDEVKFLKELNPELYEHFKLDLYSIVTDEKYCFSIDLNTSWHYVGSLFQCGILMETNTYFTTIDNRDSVNIFAGELVDPNDTSFGAMRYQEVDKVLEMTQVLSEGV
jgi:hypothetical protein